MQYPALVLLVSGPYAQGPDKLAAFTFRVQCCKDADTSQVGAVCGETCIDPSTQVRASVSQPGLTQGNQTHSSADPAL